MSINPRRRSLVLTLPLAGLFAGCGGDHHDALQATSDGSPNPYAGGRPQAEPWPFEYVAEPKALGAPEALDLSGPWQTWEGGASPVSYDAATDALVIPGNPDVDLSYGVHRFDHPLDVGASYDLSLAGYSGPPDHKVAIYPFGPDGLIFPLEETYGRFWIQQGHNLTFPVVRETAGFFLQVENGYRAAEAVTLRPTLRRVIPAGTRLLRTDQAWTTWAREANPLVRGVGNKIELLPSPTGGITEGVQFYDDLLLTRHSVYELSILGDIGSNLSIFFFLDNTPGWPRAISIQPTSDVSATGQQGFTLVRFEAPDSASFFRVSFAIQVQGRPGATETETMLIDFRETGPNAET